MPQATGAAAIWPPYVTVAEARAAGYTTAMISDEDLANVISMAEDYIESQTYLWFNLHAGEIVILDGDDSPVLSLPAPAIAIESVTVSQIPGESIIIAPSQYINYNRRNDITGDFWDPRLEMLQGVATRMSVIAPTKGYDSRSQAIWPWGRHNISILGTFGFVETDGSTPLIIKRAVLLLINQLIVSVLQTPTERIRLLGLLESESIGNYSYRINTGKVITASMFTNDPLVDEILDNYTRVEDIRGI